MSGRMMLAGMLLAAALVSPARAGGFDDYAMVLDECATVEGGALVLTACAGTCSDTVAAKLIAPLPGTLVFDLQYDMGVPIAWLDVTSSGDAADVQVILSCPPCSGTVTTIAI